MINNSLSLESPFRTVNRPARTSVAIVRETEEDAITYKIAYASIR